MKTYRELAKSGIVALVLISVTGGYLAGHPPERPVDWLRLFLTLAGVMFLSGGSSALNQVQERHIDAVMPRTSKRPLPSGRISLLHARLFVTVTMVLGSLILWKLDPWLLALGLAAAFMYNVLYTLWWKKHWAFAAIPGAVPGALPILMGFVAAQDSPHSLRALAGGIYLFWLLFFWQMPHFWVLALKFKEDYAIGAIPTLPVHHGEPMTKHQISLWTLGYIATAHAAPLFFKLNRTYYVIALLTSFKLLWDLRKYLARSAGPTVDAKAWLPFFLWVNFSLIIYIGACVIDLWLNHFEQYWV